MDGTEEHGGGGQTKNGKENVNVRHTGQLGNHDAHDTGREGIFEPTKGTLAARNVVMVGRGKDEGGQVAAATQGQKDGRIPHDAIAFVVDAVTLWNAKILNILFVQTSRKVRKQEPVGVGLAVIM